MHALYRYVTRYGYRNKWMWLTSSYFIIMLVIIFRDNIHLQKMSKKIFAGTEPPWISMAESMEQQDEKILRCTGEDMGCFTVLAEYPPKKGSMARNECLKFCFESGNTYAGQTAEGHCYCGNTLDRFVAKRLCDVACSADRSKNCTVKDAIRIHRKTKDCQTGVQETSLNLQQIGCIPIPMELKRFTKAFQMKGMTGQQCILKCEAHKFQLAVPILTLGACLCSDAPSLFGTARDMLRAMRSCGSGNGFDIFRVTKISVYRTFADSICASKRFLRPTQGPFAILTSFWGSGNTWMRHLIESATGIYTGSVYNDDGLYRGGLIGERVHYLSGRTIIIKDHIMSKPEKVSRRYESAILLVRNPYDASLSEYTRLHTHNNHTGLIDPKIYESEGFRKSVAVLPGKWLYHAQMLFQVIPKVLVVYYEDVVQNPVKEMRRIVDFLPHDLVKDHAEQFEKGLMCMNLDLIGSFRRPPKGLRSNPYDAELQDKFNTAIKRFDWLMKSKNMHEMPASYFKKWTI